MDPVSILLLVCWCFYVCLWEKREREALPACVCATLWWQGKLGILSSILLKPLDREGRGRRKTKVTGIVGRKSVSLHWEPVSADASWPKLAGSCPSKWQQLLAVRESMSQSEEKSDGIYINTTLMAHLALRRVPGCATDSQAFDRQSPAHQTRMACQMAGRRLRGAQICQTLSDAVVTQAREVKASFHTWLVLDMDGERGRGQEENDWLVYLAPPHPP